MFRRCIPLFLILLTLTLVLAACGDEKVTVPTYPGATSVTLPDSVIQTWKAGLTNLQNVKVETYKTGDELAKVKDTFASGFQKDGWTDKNSDPKVTSGVADMAAAGVFSIYYIKGNTAVAVLGMPGSLMTPAGVPGLSDSDTLIVVFSGQGK